MQASSGLCCIKMEAFWWCCTKSSGGEPKRKLNEESHCEPAMEPLLYFLGPSLHCFIPQIQKNVLNPLQSNKNLKKVQKKKHPAQVTANPLSPPAFVNLEILLTESWTKTTESYAPLSVRFISLKTILTNTKIFAQSLLKIWMTETKTVTCFEYKKPLALTKPYNMSVSLYLYLSSSHYVMKVMQAAWIKLSLFLMAFH